MNRAERKAWLAGLKEGDKVAEFYGAGTTDSRPKIRTIKHRTHDAIIADMRVFDADGKHRRRGCHVIHIEPVTPELLIAKQDRADDELLRAVSWYSVPVEVRRQIAVLLRGVAK